MKTLNQTQQIPINFFLNENKLNRAPMGICINATIDNLIIIIARLMPLDGRSYKRSMILDDDCRVRFLVIPTLES